MKKIAIASAIALASISAAHAEPQVYGKVLLTGEYTNTDYENPAKDDQSTTQLVSNSSRIGFKGDEEIMDGTNLIYQLEYGINVDDNSAQFTSRNTYLGLQNNQYGTLLAGRHDTPFKLSKGSVDVFNDYKNVELGNLMAGENRANNVVAYKSPAIVGMPVTFMAAVTLSENDNDADAIAKLGTSTTAKDALGNPTGTTYYADKTDKDNGYSASLAYDQNGVYLAGGYDNNVGAVDSAWRVAGSVDMGKMNMIQGLTLGALYQQSQYFDTYKLSNAGVVPVVATTTAADDEKSWLISGKYKIGATPWAVKAQYITTENYKGVKDTDADEIALGAEYSFNKATKAHMYAAQINTDRPAANADEDKTIVGAGLEYKF